MNRPVTRFAPVPMTVALALCLAIVVQTVGSATPETPAGLGPRLIDPETVEPVNAEEFEQVLHHYRGKVVLVNLWATWCIPCIQELPDLKELQDRYQAKGLQVLALSMDEPEGLEEKVRPFFAKRGAGLISYLQADEDEEGFMKLLDPEWPGSLPTSFLIDREGQVRKVMIGRKLFQEFEQALLPLL